MKALNKYLVVLVLLPFVFQGAMAKPGMGRGGQMMGKNIIAGLNLTAEQQQQVNAIMQETKTTLQAQAKPDIKANAAERLALIKTSSFDEAEARAMMAAHQQKMMEKKLLILKSQQQVYQLLTPEQQAQYDTLFLQRVEQMGQGRGKGRGKGYGKGMQ